MRKEFCVPVVGMGNLDDLVCGIKGGTMVSVEYFNDTQSMNKKLRGGKSNPYYNSLECKTYAISLQVAVDYEKAVSNRAGVEFTAHSLPWGQWFCVERIIEHKGKHYFRLYETKNTKFYRQYFLNGQLVTDAYLIQSIEGTFYEKKGSNRQAELGLSLEEQVKPFNIEFGNLRKFKANKQTFEVIHL